MAASIQLSRLTIESSSASGGLSTVHSCLTPDGGRQLLKLYSDEAREELDAEALHLVVEAPLVAPVQQPLWGHTCWPEAVVLDGGSIAGVLMPSASVEYFESPDSPRHMNRIGRPPEDSAWPYYQVPQKIARVGKLVGLVQQLHRRGVVVGDVHPRNVLIGAADAEPKVCLIDCDSVVVHGKSAFHPRQPLDWKIEVPSGGNDFSRATDYGKLGLLALRVLYEDFALNSFDLDALEVVLKRRDIDLLDRAARGWYSDQDEVAWGSLAGTWEKFDRGDAKLYYRNDEFEFQRWSSEIWPLPVTQTERPVEPEAAADEQTRSRSRSRTRSEAGAGVAAKAEPLANPEAASTSSGWLDATFGVLLVSVSLLSMLFALIVVVLGGVMLGSGDIAVFFGVDTGPAAARPAGAIVLAVLAGLFAVFGAGIVAVIAEWTARVVVPLLSGIAIISALVFFGPPQQHVSAVAGKVPGLGWIVPHEGK
ncbi:MAG: hypothetical protein QOH03_5420 [Kribbellaceae bacterium]|jgi:hypothetical protein|nr:hypothetical protein [Kribbellaceae bacterium]